MSFLWTVTTVYTYNPGNLDSGGTTRFTEPTPVKLTTDADRRVRDVKDPIFRKGLSRSRLKKYLKKKVRDRRRCPI